MRLNPEKYTFEVQVGKFLDFYLTEQGIEANSDKCRAFAEFPTPKSKKCIQTLNGMLTLFSRFIAKSAQHALPFFKLLRNETKFEWTNECESALAHLKNALSHRQCYLDQIKAKHCILISLSPLMRSVPS